LGCFDTDEVPPPGTYGNCGFQEAAGIFKVVFLDATNR
jgi:hypothetical protein